LRVPAKASYQSAKSVASSSAIALSCSTQNPKVSGSNPPPAFQISKVCLSPELGVLAIGFGVGAIGAGFEATAVQSEYSEQTSAADLTAWFIMVPKRRREKESNAGLGSCRISR